MEMNLNQKLPEMGLQLFAEVDPQKNIDSLQCPICMQYYTPSAKKPMISCKNKHVLCEQCVKKLIKDNDVKNQLEMIPYGNRLPARCFCRDNILEDIVIDEEKLVLCKQLENINNRLKQVSEEVRLLLLKQCQRKTRKNYQIRIQQLQKRQRQVCARQDDLRSTVQALLDRQQQLEFLLSEANKRNKQLSKINDALIQGVCQNEKISKPQQTIQPVSSKKRKGPRLIYNHNTCYKQFKFSPYKNAEFRQNFIQLKYNDKFVVKLQKGRIKDLVHQDLKKVIIHKSIFDAKNQENRLICFKIRNINSKVARYSFGLMDQYLKPIKGASVSLYLYLKCSQNIQEDVEQQGTITCYVDLVKKKLHMQAGIAKISNNIAPAINIQKFAVYLYYLDSETQYELNDQDSAS